MLVNGGMAQVNLDGCSPADLSSAMQTGREMIDHILNRIMRPLIPGMRNAFVRKTAAFPGVRETRKIVGKCRLTEEMLLSGATPEKIEYEI
ncbi:MAG: FAD-dependent oxidoreductase [Lentisphaeria bacterium]|nr:MAG: FAD-dependent oxidoreductase [Lentisphaeria bacterium]